MLKHQLRRGFVGVLNYVHVLHLYSAAAFGAFLWFKVPNFWGFPTVSGRLSHNANAIGPTKVLCLYVSPSRS